MTQSCRVRLSYSYKQSKPWFISKRLAYIRIEHDQLEVFLVPRINCMAHIVQQPLNYIERITKRQYGRILGLMMIHPVHMSITTCKDSAQYFLHHNFQNCVSENHIAFHNETESNIQSAKGGTVIARYPYKVRPKEVRNNLTATSSRL